MRWLKYLISEDSKDNLNSKLGSQWLVIVIMLVLGFFLVITGINGIKTKRIKDRYGNVFKGTTAQVLGTVYALLGVAVLIMAIATKS